jgi:hypothetical protein
MTIYCILPNRYTDAVGQFLMNSKLEIAMTYKDFYAGKYGVIED